MLQKRIKRKGYRSIELRRGYDGQGKGIYVVQAVKSGRNVKHRYMSEQFKNKASAERFIKKKYPIKR